MTVTASGHYAEEYQNNTVSQISGKISRMHKWLKPGILSTIHEHQVRGYVAIVVAVTMKDAGSSAANVVLHVHAAAASCECSNSLLACSGS